MKLFGNEELVWFNKRINLVLTSKDGFDLQRFRFFSDPTHKLWGPSSPNFIE